MIHINNTVRTVCLCLLIIKQSFALESDKNEVMQVTADSARLNQQTHQGTYIGQVIFIQGTTHLNAAKALTKINQDNKLILAIAEGEKDKPAHYWTETGPNKPPFHAYANTIKYYPLRHKVVLIGNALIKQGLNSLSAAKITYDTEKQHLISESTPTKRTTIVLYPEKKPT